jgi:hypothetical protein
LILNDYSTFFSWQGGAQQPAAVVSGQLQATQRALRSTTETW